MFVLPKNCLCVSPEAEEQIANAQLRVNAGQSFDRYFAAMFLDKRGKLTEETMAELGLTPEECRNYSGGEYHGKHLEK